MRLRSIRLTASRTRAERDFPSLAAAWSSPSISDSSIVILMAFMADTGVERISSWRPHSLPQPQHRHERFLRDLHVAHALHLLLALGLLLQELALARDVAAIALRQHVLPHRPDR